MEQLNAKPTSEMDVLGTSLSNTLSILEPESHLRNLGLEIQDLKPKFKLDEPAPTGLCTTNDAADFTMIDANDTLSFVVLGQNSLDSIHASSLASYADIKQKTTSVDYNSMVSTLSSDEIQQKLIKLLQENQMLKETLNQNNVAMKKQFNTLVTWQEEVMRVHQSHKKKFGETRDLINCLKQENANLKLKLSTEYTNQEKQSVTDQLKSKSIINSPKVSQLEAQIALLMDELNRSKAQCTELTKEVHEYTDLINTMNSQLQQPASTTQEQNEVITMESKNQPSNQDSKEQESDNFSLLLPHITSQVQNKDALEEIIVLKNQISTLELQLQTNSLHICSMHIQSNQADEKAITVCQQLVHDVKQYQETLQQLNDCYSSQISRYCTIQEQLKECTNIFEIIDSFNTSANPKEHFLINREKLVHCQKELMSEQLRIVEDRQKLIKTQGLIQTIFHDYNSVLNQLRIILEENSKLHTINQNLNRQIDQMSKEVEKSKEHETSLDKQRQVLATNTEILRNDRINLDHERKMMKMQLDDIMDEKRLLEQERKNLLEEKASLDRQSQLYENYEKTFQMEKKKMEKECDRLVADKNSLEAALRQKDHELENLRKQMIENIESLSTALKFYENDFRAEKEAKESLLKEKTHLQNELEIHMSRKEQACNANSTSQSSQGSSHQLMNQNDSSDIVLFCPRCQMLFGTPHDLQEHIERCLDLN